MTLSECVCVCVGGLWPHCGSLRRSSWFMFTRCFGQSAVESLWSHWQHRVSLILFIQLQAFFHMSSQPLFSLVGCRTALPWTWVRVGLVPCTLYSCMPSPILLSQLLIWDIKPLLRRDQSPIGCILVYSEYILYISIVNILIYSIVAVYQVYLGTSANMWMTSSTPVFLSVHWHRRSEVCALLYFTGVMVSMQCVTLALMAAVNKMSTPQRDFWTVCSLLSGCRAIVSHLKDWKMFLTARCYASPPSHYLPKRHSSAEMQLAPPPNRFPVPTPDCICA